MPLAEMKIDPAVIALASAPVAPARKPRARKAPASAAPSLAANAAKFHKSSRAKRTFAIAANAPRADVPEVSDTAFVAYGAHVAGDWDALVLRNGSTDLGMPLSAIGRALAGGVISLEDIVSQLSDRDCERLAKLLK